MHSPMAHSAYEAQNRHLYKSPSAHSSPMSTGSAHERVVLRDVNNEQDNGYPVGRKTPVKQVMQMAGSSPLTTTHKRRTAAAFIESVTGDMLPSATDREFRSALRNGIVLCKLANALDSSYGIQILEPNTREAAHRNLNSFLRWAEHCHVPLANLFSINEIESEGWEESPRIAECICYVKSIFQMQPYAASHAANNGMDPNYRPSSAASNYSVASRASSAQGGSPSNGAQPAPKSSKEARLGVTKLMQQCSQLLKERMTVDASPRPKQQQQQPQQQPQQQGGNANGNGPVEGMSQAQLMEYVSPIVENVLSGLTKEYETRLLKKDNEVNVANDKAARLEKRYNELQVEHDKLMTDHFELKEQMEHKVVQAGQAASERSLKELDCLRMQNMELSEKLQSFKAQFEEVEASSHKVAKERLKDIQEELQAARSKLNGLADIETRYCQIQEENRKLYNMVQDLKGSIRVFCRIRPLGKTGDANPPCLDVGNDGELAIYDPVKGDRKMFKFDKVFDMGSTQPEIYADTEPLVRSVLDGYNVCIFAYGQTGSGKTHTMSGSNVHNMDGRGINYRALDDLFELRDQRSDEVEYDIKVQMLEIYNENLRDLLYNSNSGSPGANTSKKLDILNTQASGCNVPGANQIDVFTSDDVMEMMEQGARNRAVGETKMNQRSSRSHQILTVIVDGYNRITGAKSHGCLHLVDLAGSERVSKSEATGDRLLEAQHINKSLSALGDVMSALASKNSHVPFRNSKLTQLLQDSLSGQAKVMMFMHIAPECSSFGESLSTLKFGVRVSEITLGQAKKNVESGKVFEAHEQVSKAQHQVDHLQAQLREAKDVASSLRSENASLNARLAELEYKLSRAGSVSSSSKKTPSLSQESSSSGSGSFDSSDSLQQEHHLLSVAIPATGHSPRTYTPSRSPGISPRSADLPITPTRSRWAPKPHATAKHIERMQLRRPSKEPTSGPASPSLYTAPAALGGAKTARGTLQSTLSARAPSKPTPSPPTSLQPRPSLGSRMGGTVTTKAGLRPDSLTSRIPGAYTSTANRERPLTPPVTSRRASNAVGGWK